MGHQEDGVLFVKDFRFPSSQHGCQLFLDSINPFTPKYVPLGLSQGQGYCQGKSQAYDLGQG